MAERTDVVEEFLKELLPKDLLESAQLLASLDYPIPDRKSLLLQLEKQQVNDQEVQKGDSKPSEPMSAFAERVAEIFEPEDFGIDTPRSALEKFFGRINRRQAFLPGSGSLGPTLPPDLSDAPSEPIPFPPADSDFGSDMCGRAAAQLWREHLASPLTQLLGPSPAFYSFLKQGEALCRREARPRFTGRCREEGEIAYARCIILGGRLVSRSQCLAEAHRAIEICRRLSLEPPPPRSFRGGRFP